MAGIDREDMARSAGLKYRRKQEIIMTGTESEDPRNWGAIPVNDGGPDDWRPVTAENPRDWGAEQIDDWIPVEAQKQPFVADPFELTATIPEAFLDRVRRGYALNRILDKAVGGIVEGFGTAPLGLSPEHVRQLRDVGVLHDPHNGPHSVINLLTEGATDATATGL